MIPLISPSVVSWARHKDAFSLINVYHVLFTLYTYTTAAFGFTYI